MFGSVSGFYTRLVDILQKSSQNGLIASTIGNGHHAADSRPRDAFQ